MLTVNRDNLRKSHQAFWFLIDFLMLGLLVININWIILDSLYAVDVLREGLAAFQPDWVAAYAPIHRNFIFYDLIFVWIFLSEFFIRWAYAIKAKVYQRWYFYPFIHAYDLLGCIPIGAYRFLRILRVFSIIYRLHQYQIIDVTQWRVYQFFNFYYEAFMEELSDRIVIKVLSGAQIEIRHGSPMLHRIRRDLLLPRRPLLASWLSRKISETAQTAYQPNQAEVRRYLEDKVNYALEHNLEIQRLGQIPLLGESLKNTLEEAVATIVSQVIHQLLQDLTHSTHTLIADALANQLVSDMNPDKPQISEAMIELVLAIIEEVKAQIHVKRWREAL